MNVVRGGSLHQDLAEDLGLPATAVAVAADTAALAEPISVAVRGLRCSSVATTRAPPGTVTLPHALLTN